MDIVMASSEMTPYAKTGGLADVVGALSDILSRRGHKVTVFIPFYHCIPIASSKLVLQEKVWLGQRLVTYTVFRIAQRGRVTVYAIRKEEYFDRLHLYGTADHDYEDNAERFIFFSKAVVHTILSLHIPFDILHTHDWQTALIPIYAKSTLPQTRTVCTIHNLAYQGIFAAHNFQLTNLPPHLFSIDGLEFYGQMNLLKGGILFADAITTVSRRYAQEIQTPEYGCGLDGVLRLRRNSIQGILNGVDDSVWNPETDSHLAQTYGATSLKGKSTCKKALVLELQLSSLGRKPILSIVSRFAQQKGLDLVLGAMPIMLKKNLRFAILGNGDSLYEEGLRQWAARHPTQIGLRIGFDEGLAHRIYAGSDFLLMPSRYEPCGLSQLYAMRYGTIPIARATGGLEDTIQEWNPKTRQGTGFKFDKTEVTPLLSALKRALHLYRQPKVFPILQQNAMKTNFSWENSVAEYETLYQSLLSFV